MRAALAATLCAAAVVSGCAEYTPAGGTQEEPVSTPSPTAQGAGELPRGSDPVTLDPAELTTDITNNYWPMRPGTRWVYREVEDGETSRVVVTVTSQTRQIANGVTARVVRDTVSSDGEVVEDTFDWYAQDADGNIWYLGEDTAEFEDGELVTREGSFEAGVDGALPGVALPGSPVPGVAYRQEYYEGHAEDNGEVLSTDEMAEVPAGQYDGVLLTKDTIALEPDVLEYKLYAPGVGPVLVYGVSGGRGLEELLSVDHVSARAAERAGTTPLGGSYR